MAVGDHKKPGTQRLFQLTKLKPVAAAGVESGLVVKPLLTLAHRERLTFIRLIKFRVKWLMGEIKKVFWFIGWRLGIKILITLEPITMLPKVLFLLFCPVWNCLKRLLRCIFVEISHHFLHLWNILLVVVKKLWALKLSGITTLARFWSRQLLGSLETPLVERQVSPYSRLPTKKTKTKTF